MSFGAIATDYDRLRPSPAQEAVRWLLPASCEIAVDLAAGTGLFTRAVASEARNVVAVEPDARMASVLKARSPGVHVVSGRGEALPLRSSAADAVLISSAWHWMDPQLAVPEIARVLRHGGRFGVIWTSRDRSVDWVAELDRLREPLTTSEYRRRRREVTLPDSRALRGCAGRLVHLHQIDDHGRSGSHARYVQRADHGEPGRARERARPGQGGADCQVRRRQRDRRPDALAVLAR